MRILKLVVGAAVAMALVAAGFAHASIDNAGTTAANFLTVGSGPRTLAMGGAALGISDELGGLSWNAASLGWVNRTEFALSHAGLSNESAQEWAALGGRFGESQTRWSLSGLYQGDGSFEGRDASNNPTGSFGVSSIAFGAHLAHQFGEQLTIGAGAKSVNEKLGDVTGSGFTFDVGVMYRNGIFGVGAAAQNLLGQMKFDGIPFQFPTNYGIGVGAMIPATGVRLAVDANFPTAYFYDMRFGAEWLWKDMIALRAGYRQELGSYKDPLTGPTFGVGAGKHGLWMDYGYLLSGNGESQHRLGLRLLPGGFSSLTGSLGPLASAGPAVAKPVREPKRVAAKPSTASKTAKSGSSAKTVVPKAQAGDAAKAATAPMATAVAGDGPKTIPVTKVKTPTFPPIKPAAPKVAPAKVTEQMAVNLTPPPAKVEPAPAKSEAPAVAKSEPAPANEESASEARPKTIRVQKGDTLAGIGRRFKVSVPAIMMENNLVNDQLRIGQVLKVPDERR
ncbi:MAG TPA: PorV/PorQ family protein [Candidatus Limnocylindria bacterium]|nr:PorV/PorQ family protein [Candidatus Limnocylindria bacterium]